MKNNDNYSATGSREIYWMVRCRLAENFIEKSPCDPDITKEQYSAFVKWQDHKNKSLPKVESTKTS